MKTWHIHISGLVQGVGFRPLVCRLAAERKLAGWVSNTTDGLHIRINSTHEVAAIFLRAILENPPPHAIITGHHLEQAPETVFTRFTIKEEETNIAPTRLLLTPDYALCPDCRNELADKKNRRYHYPFTTCLQCGPRYSVIRSLPYERKNTSMAPYTMCEACETEYQDIQHRRHYSQTNSCPHCEIPMHLYNAARQELASNPETILPILVSALRDGKTAAVKGIGGYLLLCDATNEAAVLRLRKRKQRPQKPFALLYPSATAASGDVWLTTEEKEWLVQPDGPILLCRLKEQSASGLCTNRVAPGLDKAGLMLPSTPLLQLIAVAFEKPLVATSANISGSPIIYKDEEALRRLTGLADLVLTYEREIVVPQDDSVVQRTAGGQRIILRRSRGLAPNFYPVPFSVSDECILAFGGELKSAFALQKDKHVFISQYLGNQESLDAQTAFRDTADHLLRLLDAQPGRVLCDSHPGYFVSQEATAFAAKHNIPLTRFYHHEAHFAAVLAENELLDSAETVLGVIWDGAGYGEDKQVWGGEFFIYNNGIIHRRAHLDYFPQLLGDKMNREPRLAALSLLRLQPGEGHPLQHRFTTAEWDYYQKILQQPPRLLTSSMGRLLDGIASLLGVCQQNSYEGEAAMKLEALARSCDQPITEAYPLPLQGSRLMLHELLHAVLADHLEGVPASCIAKKVFYSLAVSIRQVSDQLGIRRLAFSGGVFQNALLDDMIRAVCDETKQLYRHRQLSPNDECIGLGQLACYYLQSRAAARKKQSKPEEAEPVT